MPEPGVRAEPVAVATPGPWSRSAGRGADPAQVVEIYAPSEVPPPPRRGHTADMSRIRVAVIDGQRTFADALASRLAAEPDIQLVAVSESAAAAHRLLSGRPVDLVLLDSELMRSLDHPTADMPPSARLILVGPVPDAARIVTALRAGVAGWVVKEESTEQLLHVIRGVMRDEAWVPATVVGPVLRLLLHGYREGDAAGWGPLARLTPREREVLGYLAEGIDRWEVAERMQLSAATVRSHVQNLLRKLGVHSTLEAVAVARQAQLGPGAARADEAL
jgi:DNA-binding NarL/FixJ family response regulator